MRKNTYSRFYHRELWKLRKSGIEDSLAKVQAQKAGWAAVEAMGGTQ